MAMTREQMDRKIDQHFGFEATDNVDGVLSTLADDVVHDIVGWPNGPSHGRDAARIFYESMFVDLADSKVSCVKRLYGDDFLIDESIWSGKAVGKPFGLEGKGRALEFRLLHIIEFTQDGDIRRENVWFDFPAILRQLS